MLFLAVVTQALAVIREQDDRRLVVESLLPQVVQQLSDDLVGVLHLAVVGIRLGDARWRRVRCVRLVNVSEQKEFAPPASVLIVDPRDGRSHRLFAAALHLSQRLVR